MDEYDEEIPYSVKKIPPGGFLAITRDHGHLQVPGSVEKLPISLLELPKPSRTSGNSQKPMFVDSIYYRKRNPYNPY